VSDADNLVAGDGNGASDVFVYDRASGQTTLESRGSDGALADDWSYYPAISADGRVVAFDSLATNLAANDGERPDVFVRDRASGQTRIASVSLTGGKADYPSFAPVLSADGRYVAFDSSASNLVAFDANGNGSDVFVRDLAAGTTALVSVDAGASAQPDQSFDAAISPDGSFVAFAGLSVLSSGAADCQYYLRGPLRPPGQPDVPLAAPSTTVPPVETTSLTTEAPSTSTSLSTEPPPAAPTSTLVPTTAPTVG
ncbi:MAG TPA: hypothetical protein VEP73_01805, partial [Actinomycetota bacterium]|nr:hypothetical protein [Actinomycetota bacterium]